MARPAQEAIEHQAIHTRFAHLDRSWVKQTMSQLEASLAEMHSFGQLMKVQKRVEEDIIKLCLQAEGCLRNIRNNLETVETYIEQNDRAGTEEERKQAIEGYSYGFGHLIHNIEEFNECLNNLRQRESQLEKAHEKNSRDIERVKKTITKLKQAEKTHVTRLLNDLKIDSSDFQKIRKELGW